MIDVFHKMFIVIILTIGILCLLVYLILSFLHSSKHKAIIITLDSNECRKNLILNLQKDLQEIETELYYGVDGSDILIQENTCSYLETEVYMYDRTRRINQQPMSRGEFGCALSHLKLYQRLMRDSTFDYYIILEDDAEVIGNLEYLDHLPSSFHVIHLGQSEYYPFERDKVVNECYSEIKRQYFSGAYAYIISKEGAQILLNITENGCHVPADDLMSNSFVNGMIDVYVANEPIFGYVKNIPSTIKRIDIS